MGYYVGNDYGNISSVSDYGGRNLLNIKSLTNYVNYGNSSGYYGISGDNFTASSKYSKAKRRFNSSNFLSKLPMIMTTGIAGACLIKTGYIKKLPNKIASLFKGCVKLFKRN